MSSWALFQRYAEAARLELRSRPVATSRSPAALLHAVEARFDLLRPVSLDTLIPEVAGLLEDGLVHVTHPRYFGLFNPSVRESAVCGDVLAALFNPQLAVRSHAPAADALERLVLRRLAGHVGPAFEAGAMNFTSGGAEANLSALLSALAHAVPQALEIGLAEAGVRPRVYVTRESHHSFVKAVRMAGLGTAALREVALGPGDVMDPGALEAALREDARSGLLPLLVVATAGTTAAGLVDPLPDLARVATAAGVWLHVDAAWGGLALLSPALRAALDGIAQADSVTWDAHKGLAVPMGAGMFFCRHREPVERAFAVSASYMPPAGAGEPEPFAATARWSRRAIGLKVFMALAEQGLPGVAASVEAQARLADALRGGLRERGWEILNATPLPLVCFTHPEVRAGRVAPGELLARVNARGRVWLSEVDYAGRERALRACITSFRSDALDVEVLIEELEGELRARPRPAPAPRARVALLTCGGFPDLAPDDALLQEALAQRRVRADAVAWDSPSAGWEAFDALLVRSCWDYHLRPAEFEAWLRAREAQGARLLNPAPLLRWNADKAYLLALARQGVRVPPTRRVPPGSGTTLCQVLDDEGWDHAVVKPAVSAAGHATWRCDRADAASHEARFSELLRSGAALVQAFVPQVTQGEWSLCYFDGRFSHAVLKRPAPGDFRVQAHFGGSVAALAPPDAALRAAETALARTPQRATYARVDGCMVDGAFVLMELELLEPALFLATANGAAGRLADAVVRRLDRDARAASG